MTARNAVCLTTAANIMVYLLHCPQRLLACRMSLPKPLVCKKIGARISALEKEKCKNEDMAKSIKNLQDEAERKKAIEAQMKKDGGCALASINHNESGGAHNYLVTLPMNLILTHHNHLLILPMKLLTTLHRPMGI